MTKQLGLTLALGLTLVYSLAFGLRAQAPTSTSTPTINLPAVVSQVKVNVKEDCGAKGDGITNDTDAFYRASQLIQQKGGGTLLIPQGTYIVGKQFQDAGQPRYYMTAPIFEVKGINGLLIEGNNAILKMADGLRYGSFDNKTGEPYHPPKMPFMKGEYPATLGSMVNIEASRNVIIRNLELDGNLGNLVLGGFWGDMGRQLFAYGIRLIKNSDVWLDKVNAHHHALDGLLIGYPGLKEGDAAAPHTLTDCRFEYNGRQGLSWVGGRSLKVYRSQFNHTGRALNNNVPLASAPGVGLDIEAEDSVTRDGYFEECQFINNTGPGMASDSGNGGYAKFKDCLFWGTTSWSTWSNKPGLQFEDCKIYGSAIRAFGSPDPALATNWKRCVFEDKPWSNGKVYRNPNNGLLLEASGNLENVLLEDCDFIANTSKSVWAVSNAKQRISFRGCSFTHKNTALPEGAFYANFRNANFTGCHFKEEIDTAVAKKWYLEASNCNVAAEPPTLVDGPAIKWRSWSAGATGILPPATVSAE